MPQFSRQIRALNEIYSERLGADPVTLRDDRVWLQFAKALLAYAAGLGSVNSPAGTGCNSKRG
jgi:hypothetical protein